jgi:hypothetical protein
MKVMLAYFHELVSAHSVSSLVYLSFCLESRRNIAPYHYRRTTPCPICYEVQFIFAMAEFRLLK